MIRKLLAVALLLLCPGAAAVRHQGPPIWVEVSIEESLLVLAVSGEPDALRVLLGDELLFQEPVTLSDREDLRSAFSEFVAAGGLLAIDGAPARGQFDELRLPSLEESGESWQVVQARFLIPIPPRASELSVRWTRFEGTDWNGESVVPLTLLEGHRVATQATLSPSEPEFRWGLPSAADAIASSTADGQLLPSPADRLRLPLLSLMLAIGALALLVSTRRRDDVRSYVRVAAFGLFIAAALLRGHWSVPLPWSGQRANERPNSEQALAIFEVLHGRIYQAFSASNEAAIYELLESSVHPSILDEVYGEIYESLVMREHGGAVCSIEGIDEGSGRVVFPAGESALGAFRVEWAWTLNGLVSHWGHLHRRRNEYEAVYEVVLDNGAWKIGNVEVLQHRRVDLMDASLKVESTESD